MPKLTSRRIHCHCAAALLLIGSVVAGEVSFSRDVRPILSDKCFHCHGPDEHSRKAKLRLDTREGALADLGDYAAVKPGDPAASELIARIMAHDPDEIMPPPETNKPVTAAEREILAKWITQGAEYEAHWAFVPVKRPAVPAVATPVANPIDAFIRDRLQAEGLAPAAPADKRTLIRRVSLDLTGLPPTPAEVEAFVNDASPDAYDRLVDRLLASPRYGEHMGRYWLDAARYGDTHGLHFDNYRSMWPYRDWVIKAFNANQPFDDFTIEQLAGDQLPQPSLQQRVATGFNRCNVTTNENGVIADEIIVQYAVDRASTTGTVWLGLTVACAQCHDHKFDPVSQREFFQLFAYFNNTAENPMDGNKAAVPPVVNVPSPTAQAAREQAQAELADIDAALAARQTTATAEFAKWLQQAAQPSAPPPAPAGLDHHFPLDELAAAGSTAITTEAKAKVKLVPGVIGKALRVGGGGTLSSDCADFDRQESFSYGTWVKTSDKRNGGIIARMDANKAYRGYDLFVLNGHLSVHLINKWPENALKVVSEKPVDLTSWTHALVTYDGSSKAAGVKLYVNGEAVPLAVDKNSLTGSIRTAAPFRFGARTGKPVSPRDLDDIRIYRRALTPIEVRALYELRSGTTPLARVLATPADERTPAQRDALLQHYLRNVDKPYQALLDRRAAVDKTLAEAAADVATTLVMQERMKPRGAFILERGQYDQPGERVQPGVPAFLPPLPADDDGKRLGLAKWLVNGNNPLTARVTVNRFWQQVFGTGIVRTAEDFGLQGEWPSHPELLDWLADEFVRSGWNVKQLMRLLVTSDTYRQAARLTPELIAKDPENRLLARGPRFRLDGEVLRDQALAVSGLLVNRLGGEPVKPYQPPGIWKAVGFTASDTANFKRDSGDKLYRRTAYSFWKRTAPPPSMTTFDAPSRETCVVRRERTNTPLQALVLMNDEQFVEAARHLATRTLKETGHAADDRIRHMFELATARPPTAEELADLGGVLARNQEIFAADVAAAKALIRVGESKPPTDADPAELAAWTMLANLILNLDEVINKG